MFTVSDCVDKFLLVGKNNHYSLYEYNPTLTHPLAINFEPLRMVRRFRFWFELLKGGYKVYYLAVGNTIVGHCVVTPGGRRLEVSTKEDIVLGPYFVDTQFRGKGYAKLIVRMTLEHCTYDFKNAFDWINEYNIPSIKTSESLGMNVVGRLYIKGIMRKLIEDPNGDNRIYRYEKQ